MVGLRLLRTLLSGESSDRAILADVSQDNVELVRLAYDVGFAQRSVENLRYAFAEDYVFHNRPEWPGRALYRNDEMPQLWADLDDTFIEFTLVPEDFAPVGDEYVVVTLRQAARMRDSEAYVETTTFHVWNVRNGKARETWAFSIRDEAFEAAGVRQ